MFLQTGSRKHRSSERVLRALTDGTLKEWERNGYRTDTEQIQKGYRTGTGTCAEQKRNTFCQVFPVRFLLIGTVRGYSYWLILITGCLVMLVTIDKLLILKYHISPVLLMCTDKYKPCPFLSVPRNTFLHNRSEQCQCPQDFPRLLDPKYGQHSPMTANPNLTLLEQELHLGPSTRNKIYFNPY